MARPDHHSNPPDRFSPVLAAAVLKRRSVPQAHIELQGNLSTSELITLLKKKSEDSIERRLECAFIVRKLWDRVNGGEMGSGVNWYAWARKHIKLGKTQLKGHMRVANADNPREEAERQFALGWARTEKLAARFAHETDIEKSARINLQRFAKYDPIEKVMRIYEIRCKMYCK
jgi:hypothetical protein